MAKSSGLGMRLAVAGYDLGNDIGAIDRINGGPAAMEVTGIDKSAPERIGGLRDGGVEYSAWWNPAANRAHPRFSALPTTDVISSIFVGSSLGDPAVSLVAKQINYDPTRGTDGSLTCKIAMESNGYGVQWGVAGTAWQRTDTGATNGTGIDGLAASTFGLTAFLHVFSFTGTSCTVALQESSDNGGGDPFAAVTGGAFTAATGITSERIATAAGLSVERYLRVVTSGTFSECTFAVTIHRHVTSTVF